MSLSFWKSPAADTTAAQQDAGSESDATIIEGGDYKYTAEAGQNTSLPTYQEASGAPIEVISPLGYHAGFVTLIVMNLSKMIGTGIFSTRA